MLQGILGVIKKLRGGGELAQATSFFPGLHLLLFLGRGYKLSDGPNPVQISDNS